MSLIILKSNYEIDRCKRSVLKIRGNDFFISGQFNFFYSPMKKKINKTKLLYASSSSNFFIQKRKSLKKIGTLNINDEYDTNTTYNNSGRNIFQYTSMSKLFYLDNKLKVINLISNRFAIISSLKLQSLFRDEYIINNDSNNNDKKNDACETNIKTFIDDGICVKSISEQLTSFLINNRNCHFPTNIFTNHPVICEIIVYILTEFVSKHIPPQKILVSFVKNCENLQYLMYDNNEKFEYKTRTCLLNSNPYNNDIINKNIYNQPYTFGDQNFIIWDNNYNYSKKIYVNIPLTAINNKSYFKIDKNKNKHDGHNYDNENFLKDDFLKLLGKSLSYFKE